MCCASVSFGTLLQLYVRREVGAADIAEDLHVCPVQMYTAFLLEGR